MIETHIQAQAAYEATLSGNEQIIYWNRYTDEQQAADMGIETDAQTRANQVLLLEIANKRQAKEDQQAFDAIRASL